MAAATGGFGMAAMAIDVRRGRIGTVGDVGTSVRASWPEARGANNEARQP